MQLFKVKIEMTLDKGELLSLLESKSKSMKIKGCSLITSKEESSKARRVGDKINQLYTPEICELIGCNHHAVNGKIKSFNRMGEGKIEMPGRPYGDGYRASEETWKKFIFLYGN